MAEMYQVITPQKPAAILKGVGPKVAGKLSSIGIETVNDVLFHLPANYENLSVMNLADAENNEKVTVMGTVRTEPAVAYFRGGKNRLTVFMEIDGIYVKVTFFNQPYLKDKLTVGEEVRLSGKYLKHKLEINGRSEEHTSELQSRFDLVCRLLLA